MTLPLELHGPTVPVRVHSACLSEQHHQPERRQGQGHPAQYRLAAGTGPFTQQRQAQRRCRSARSRSSVASCPRIAVLIQWLLARAAGLRSSSVGQSHRPAAASGTASHTATSDPSDHLDGQAPQAPGQAGDVVADAGHDADVLIHGLPLTRCDEPFDDATELGGGDSSGSVGRTRAEPCRGSASRIWCPSPTTTDEYGRTGMNCEAVLTLESRCSPWPASDPSKTVVRPGCCLPGSGGAGQRDHATNWGQGPPGHGSVAAVGGHEQVCSDCGKRRPG